jgi:hypothetical protein
MASVNIGVKYPSVILLAIVACSGIWTALVNDRVSDPYLVRNLSEIELDGSL